MTRDEDMTTEEAWSRVMTKDEYLERCADRYFGNPTGHSVATRHGQISGVYDNQILRGTWEWEDGYFSRRSTLGDVDLGSDRIIIELNDTQMRLTMNGGKGPQVVDDRKPAPVEDDAADDEITICSTFDINPDGVDDFIVAMAENQRAVRAEPGNLEMRMFQDVDNSGVFFIFGRTAGEGGLDAHSDLVEDRGIEQRVAPTLADPPIVRSLSLTGKGATYGPREREVLGDELIVFGLFDCKPGYRDRVLAQYETQIPLVRADPANLLFNAYAIDGTDNRLVVYERWTSQAAAAEFSTARPISVETGALLAEAVNGDLASAIHTVREIEPY